MSKKHHNNIELTLTTLYIIIYIDKEKGLQKQHHKIMKWLLIKWLQDKHFKETLKEKEKLGDQNNFEKDCAKRN